MVVCPKCGSKEGVFREQMNFFDSGYDWEFSCDCGLKVNGFLSMIDVVDLKAIESVQNTLNKAFGGDND